MTDMHVHLHTNKGRVTIRPLEPSDSDIARYQSLCLDNLKRKPSLFWITHKEAESRTPEQWRWYCGQITGEHGAFGSFRKRQLIASLEVFPLTPDDFPRWQRWLQEGRIAAQAKDVAAIGRLYADAGLGGEDFVLIASQLVERCRARAAQEGFSVLVGAVRPTNRLAMRVFKECDLEKLRPEHIENWPATGKSADQDWMIRSTTLSSVPKLHS